MKKQPRKIKQWADEAYSALAIAWGLFSEEYPDASDDDKVQLVSFAPALAGIARGIKDNKQKKEAYEFVFDRTAEDLLNKESGEPVHYSIQFLLGYLDAHISFGILSEQKVDEIMAYLSENYDIGYEP